MLTRLRSEDGFTLVELLVATLIGSIVMIALLNLLDQTIATSKTVSDRSEAQQRGRVVLERISQELRSAVCVPSNASNGALLSPVYSADDDQVTFFTYLPIQAHDTTTPARMRQLIYDPVAKTLTQKTWSNLSTIPDPNTTPPDSPGGVQTLLTNVVANGQANTGVPAAFFSYWGPDDTSPMSTPVAAANVDNIARVSIGALIGPTRALGTSTANWSSMNSDATVMLPPSYSSGNATGGPQCII